MRVPGFNRPDKRVIVDVETGGRYVETQPGVVLKTGEIAASPAQSTFGTSTADPRVAEADARARAADRAYADGRLDERAARPRRRGGLLSSLLLLALVIGAVVWALAAYRPGSLTRAGAAAGNAVDTHLEAAHEEAKGAADAVKDRTGQVVENAGQALSRQGDKLKNQGQKIKGRDGT